MALKVKQGKLSLRSGRSKIRSWEHYSGTLNASDKGVRELMFGTGTSSSGASGSISIKDVKQLVDQVGECISQ